MFANLTFMTNKWEFYIHTKLENKGLIRQSNTSSLLKTDAMLRMRYIKLAENAMTGKKAFKLDYSPMVKKRGQIHFQRVLLIIYFFVCFALCDYES